MKDESAREMTRGSIPSGQEKHMSFLQFSAFISHSTDNTLYPHSINFACISFALPDIAKIINIFALNLAR
jgi:hypothetical protein